MSPSLSVGPKISTSTSTLYFLLFFSVETFTKGDEVSSSLCQHPPVQLRKWLLFNWPCLPLLSPCVLLLPTALNSPYSSPCLPRALSSILLSISLVHLIVVLSLTSKKSLPFRFFPSDYLTSTLFPTFPLQPQYSSSMNPVTIGLLDFSSSTLAYMLLLQLSCLNIISPGHASAEECTVAYHFLSQQISTSLSGCHHQALHPSFPTHLYLFLRLSQDSSTLSALSASYA